MKLNITFLLFFLTYNIYAQTLDCSSVKEGRFKIVDKELNTVTYITRKNGYQIEKSEGSNPIDFHVIWKSRCIYQLRPTTETIEILKCPPNMFLNVEILQINKESYISRSTSNMYEDYMDIEILKIE